MIDFVPHSEVAMTDVEFDPLRHREVYRVDYARAFGEIARGEVDRKVAWRWLCLNDLFFIAYFVMENPLLNSPFGVRACKMVEDNEGSLGYGVEVWARGHLKSWTMTQAQRVQRILRNPETCALVMSYKKPASDKFIFSVMQTLDKPLLKYCFPEILYERPASEAPSWSIQGGIIVKRKSTSRKEKTFEGAGLLEGMPTGGHWNDVDYDDVETLDTAKSPDVTQDLIDAYEMSRNLGMPDGSTRWRVIGTYYSHFGLLSYLRTKKGYDGKLLYKMRIIPATDDGTRDGKPIFLSQPALDELKSNPTTFNTQQLCDPTPSSELRLHFDQLKAIDSKEIPRDILKFMVLDQAGGDETAKASRDMWSYGVIGVKPRVDDIGQSEVYLLDVEADKMSHAEGINGVVQMYLRNGIIQQLGVEKVGMSTTEIHISNALRAHGRRISLEARNLVLLKPAGRSKEFRVESALQWPMNNGKLFYSTEIHSRYIQTIEEEMMKFPFFHVDILDMWAYVYDIIKEFRFQSFRDEGKNLTSEIEFNPFAHLERSGEVSHAFN